MFGVASEFDRKDAYYPLAFPDQVFLDRHLDAEEAVDNAIRAALDSAALRLQLCSADAMDGADSPPLICTSTSLTLHPPTLGATPALLLCASPPGRGRGSSDEW